MEYLADKLTRYIISKGTISKEDYGVYKYGLQTGMEMILCMAISSLIAIYLKSFMEFLFFVIVFFPLRAYFGGIHMKHFLSCLICSCTVITCVLILSKKFVFANWISLTFTIFLLAGSYALALGIMKKQKTDRDEYCFLRKQQKRIAIGVGVVALCFYIFHISLFGALLMFITFIVFSSLVLEALQLLMGIER
ncbi:MAG: accessory gene regulator B family protein [Lachnospiraceae bacterium]|nr:accessory gene regulator B family protein [Lachnospiraceae bacterium]